jgi:hypothetical protein
MATETVQRLLGRDAELQRIERLLDGLGRRSAAVLALVGEPGIGKTRLLAELEMRAAARDHLVLSGRATEFERELPFAVVVDALDRHLADIDPRRLEPLGARAWPSSGACSRRSPTSRRPGPRAGERALRGAPGGRCPARAPGRSTAGRSGAGRPPLGRRGLARAALLSPAAAAARGAARRLAFRPGQAPPALVTALDRAVG